VSSSVVPLVENANRAALPAASFNPFTLVHTLVPSDHALISRIADPFPVLPNIAIHLLLYRQHPATFAIAVNVIAAIASALTGKAQATNRRARVTG
jgi:hypothetical protein